MAKPELTAERLRELLHYDPLTGTFTRLVAASNAGAGAHAGCAAKNGYMRCNVDGRLYYMHRLAWLYMTGGWPAGDIDHVDGDRANNRWANLRAATRSQNAQNRSATSAASSGVRNVYFDNPSGRWQVKVMVNYRSKSFGYYQTIEEAAEVARLAKSDMHTFNPEFTR